MKFKTVAQAVNELNSAQASLGLALARQYPIGSRVGFNIMYGQVNLSWGRVHSIGESGNLCVETEMRKRRYKTIHFSQIERVIT